ncbi:MAG: glycosyltransferase family 2 protein [Verrucomicrobiota bacterium]|nr:glycosyltransferase family 2 protein [Verrucomicrobiota bacterium]
MPTVSFATSCWKRDWEEILFDPNYLSVHQIGHHAFPFRERILVINNGVDLSRACPQADALIRQNTLTHAVLAEEGMDALLAYFSLTRSEFTEWQLYNAIAPLTAIKNATSDYLLYMTGDVFLEKRVCWIEKALRYMEKRRECRVANLTWNNNYREAKRESYRKTWNFYVANEGFSDQMFLVRRSDFAEAIYGEIREDAAHFPRGDVWEKRVFSYMKNRGWERITYRWGSYTHKDMNLSSKEPEN